MRDDLNEIQLARERRPPNTPQGRHEEVITVATGRAASSTVCDDRQVWVDCGPGALGHVTTYRC